MNNQNVNMTVEELGLFLTMAFIFGTALIVLSLLKSRAQRRHTHVIRSFHD